MAIGGTYRISSTTVSYEFPTPVSQWDYQILGAGLNGLPKQNSYRVHTWTWPGGSLDACDMMHLVELFEAQNNDGVQLSILETDPHDIIEANEKYGTVRYTDFVILEVAPIQRSLPNYESPSCKFEVYTASHS